MALGIVHTRFGPVQGTTLGGACSDLMLFRAVPYAAPPIGKLRWQPPVDPTPWSEVLFCNTNPPACWQLVDAAGPAVDSLSNDEYYFDGFPPMSEDCLYLNICTGAQSAGEKRPVYLWLHGGGLTNGYSYEPEFNPSTLARKGIVVVQVGQRLGPFGYMALPQLRAEQGSSGNFGLMDQIKALDWVYDNIAAFGGDPDNISAGGQSGGTWKAVAMATSPRARGRVKHVIAESWLMWMMRYPTQTEAETISQTFLRDIGIDPTLSLEQLRGLDAASLNAVIERSLIPGDMVYDGDYIPFPTQRAMFEHFGSGIDFICGTNLGEAFVHNPENEPEFYMAHHDAAHELGFEYAPEQIISTKEAFYAHFRSILGSLYDTYHFEQLIQVEDSAVWETTRYLSSLGLTRRRNIGAIRTVIMERLFGAWMKKYHPENQVWAYLWTHIQPTQPEDTGTYRDSKRLLAWHSSELWYVFDSLADGIPPLRPWRRIDYQIADTLTSYWANFMRTGNPNGTDLPLWPAAGQQPGYLDLGDTMTAHLWQADRLDELLLAFACREYPFLMEQGIDTWIKECTI